MSGIIGTGELGNWELALMVVFVTFAILVILIASIFVIHVMENRLRTKCQASCIQLDLPIAFCFDYCDDYHVEDFSKYVGRYGE